MWTRAQVGSCEQGISRPCTVCNLCYVGVGCCRALMAPPAAKVTPDTQGHGHQQISATSASFWKTASNGDGSRLDC